MPEEFVDKTIVKDEEVTITSQMKAIRESVANLASNVQSEMKARKDIDDTIKNTADQAAKLTEDYQKLFEQSKADAKKMKELEAHIARMSSQPRTKGDRENLSSKEAMQIFTERLRDKDFKVKDILPDVDAKAIMSKEIDALIDMYLPNATEKQKVMVKTLTVGSESNIGLFAPADVVRGITTRVFETSPVEQEASVITTTKDTVPWIIDDEDIGDLKRGEFEPIEETGTPGAALKKIHIHKLTAYPKLSEEILEDSGFPLESFVTNKVSDRFSRTKNTWGVSGTGNGEFQGFMTLDTWADSEIYERGKIGAISTATANVFAYADFVNLSASLLPQFLTNAKFWMHRLSWAQVLLFLDGSERPLINPQAFFEGARPQILSYPVVLASDFDKPDSNGEFTSGDKPVAFCDLRKSYLIANRIGIKVTRDEITEPNFVKWYFRMRAGGGVVDYQGIKYMVAT